MPLKLVAPEALATAVLSAEIPERPGPPRVDLARDDWLRLATGSFGPVAASPIPGLTSVPPALPRRSVVFVPPWTTRVVMWAELPCTLATGTASEELPASSAAAANP